MGADASASPLNKSKEALDSSECTDDDPSSGTNGLPDVSHLLRLKFNKFQNGFRKRRALSVHESSSDKTHATFYVPTPAETSRDDVDAGSSLPPSMTVLSRISCSRLNYRKSPSECSSGRGTVTPTEELDNDSSGSNQSSKSYCRKYSYEDKTKAESSDKNGYWDQGYHSIEYSPVTDSLYRFNSYTCKNRTDDRHLFKDTSNLPAATIRLSSKSEKVPTSKFTGGSPCRSQPSPYYDSYRVSDTRKYPNRASVNYDRSTSSPDCISMNVKLPGNEYGAMVPRKIVYNESRSRTPSFCDRRRLMNVSDPVVEDDFDEHIILRNEPKTRSCRRWSQADTLAIEKTATIAKPYPAQNGFRIGDRVTVDMYSGCQLPYAALQSIEPMSMPYNLSPPPIPTSRNDKQFNKIPNLRRRSARSVSPESRKKETEAREKRQQIAQNLQKYVDQRRKCIVVGCKSNADLTSVSENDYWKKEDSNDKVSVYR